MKKRLFVFVMLFFCFIFMNQVHASEEGRVFGDWVSIRAKASSSATLLTKVVYGTPLTILEESGNFYKVIYDGVNTGYISKEYVVTSKDITLTDEAYFKELQSLGFSDPTYWPYLAYLHKLHPKWTFTPLITNLDFFKDVVNGEEGKNYIQLNSSIDKNLFFQAYTSSDKQAEAGGWYVANQTVVAYMVDPRNFLTEKTIFMFENLGYNESESTKGIVSSVFGSTSYLNTQLDGVNSYIDYYMEAGRTYSISPIHLAARTKQEGGANASYGPITGTVTSTLADYGNRTLYGFYNYYNIGAYGSNPQLYGLAYAAGYKGTSDVVTTYGRPWNSRYKAIIGGANFLSSSYISKGQYTLYFEKFNTNVFGSNSLYTNQYMTNIFAPYSEGTNVKSSYESNGVLNEAFNFIIPVYENMPDNTKMPYLLSGNNVLTGIYLNGKLLTNFDSDITEYTEYILNTTNKVNISALASSADVNIEGLGDYELKNELTKITLKVTAQNGDVKEYIINIRLVADTTTVEEVVNKLGVKVNDDYIYGINTNTAVSTIISSIQKISPTATAKIIDNNGKEKKDGLIVTSDRLIIKTLTSNEKTYKLAVNGDLNGDGIINIQDLLRIQKHLLGTTKLENEYIYAADVNYDSNITSPDLLRVQKHILGSITL